MTSVNQLVFSSTPTVTAPTATTVDGKPNLKRPRNLDLENAESKKHRPVVLETPDTGMLQLSSPQLEKFIMEQYSKLKTAAAAATTTPTPTSILFPQLPATEDQEAYARGFVDALNTLHKSQMSPQTPVLTQFLPTAAFNGLRSPVAVLSPTQIFLPNAFPSIATLAVKKEHPTPTDLQTVPTDSNNNYSATVAAAAPTNFATAPLQVQVQQQAQVAAAQQQLQQQATANFIANAVSEQLKQQLRQDRGASSNFVVNVAPPAAPQNIVAATPPPAPPVAVMARGVVTSLSNNLSSVGPARAGSSPSLSVASSSTSKELLRYVVANPKTESSLTQVVRVPPKPLNMEQVEVVKLERKRERNRVAAANCRKRKMDRIYTLEEKVTDLKSTNGNLSKQLEELQLSVCVLKERILDHMNSGCNIAVSSATLDLVGS